MGGAGTKFSPMLRVNYCKTLFNVDVDVSTGDMLAFCQVESNKRELCLSAGLKTSLHLQCSARLIIFCDNAAHAAQQAG